MKKIFVTGGTGFIGRALTARLKKLGCEVTAIGSADADLTQAGSLDGFDRDFDTIFHLAAWTQAGDFCVHHPGEQWLVNQKINTNVLDWCNRVNRRARIVAFGTSCAYAPGSAHKENEYLLGHPIEDLYTYAMTKRMLYAGLQALNKQFGQEYLVVVPSTVYGPDYYLHDKQLHFIFDLIRKFWLTKQSQLLCGATATRGGNSYLSTTLLTICSSLAILKNDVINIGANADFSIRQFMTMIMKRWALILQ